MSGAVQSITKGQPQQLSTVEFRSGPVLIYNTDPATSIWVSDDTYIVPGVAGTEIPPLASLRWTSGPTAPYAALDTGAAGPVVVQLTADADQLDNPLAIALAVANAGVPNVLRDTLIGTFDLHDNAGQVLNLDVTPYACLLIVPMAQNLAFTVVQTLTASASGRLGLIAQDDHIVPNYLPPNIAPKAIVPIVAPLVTINADNTYAAGSKIQVWGSNRTPNFPRATAGPFATDGLYMATGVQSWVSGTQYQLLALFGAAAGTSGQLFQGPADLIFEVGGVLTGKLCWRMNGATQLIPVLDSKADGAVTTTGTTAAHRLVAVPANLGDIVFVAEATTSQGLNVSLVPFY